MRQAKTISMADVSGFDGRHQHVKTDMRNAYERLDRAYEYLLPSDRYILEQYFVHKTSMAEIARATRRCPKTIKRQIKKLVIRIHSLVFDYLILYGPALERELFKTGDFVVFRGYSVSQASKLTGFSIRKIRHHMLILKQKASY